MRLFHHYHKHRLRHIIHKDFWLYELSVWLQVFARSLIGVFIPILLLKAGFSVVEVLAYFLIFNIINVPLNFLARHLIIKFGARVTLILGQIASIFYFIILYNLDARIWGLLIFLAVFAALYDTMYWVAHYYFFLNSIKKDKNVSKDTSIMHIVREVAGLLAPAIGAVVLIVSGQKTLIAISIAVLFLAIWPLYKLKHIKDKPVLKEIKPFKEYFLKTSSKRDYFSRAMFEIHSAAEDRIWPLFIFSLFGSLESVAWLPVIVSGTTILFTYMAGKANTKKRRTMIILGSMFMALTWLVRLYCGNEIFFYISVFLVGLFSLIISVPLESSLYEEGEKDTLNAATYLNVSAMFPRIFFYLALIFVVQVYEVSFVIATLVMFLMVGVNVFNVKNINTKNKFHV